MRFLSAVVAVALATTPRAADAPPTRRALYAAMAGQWTGTLEYKDYSRPDTRVTLPTKLAITYAADSSAVLMHYVYDDGPGKIVEDDDRFAADVAMSRVRWGGPKSTAPQEFAVSALAGAREPIALVLQGEGMDDNKPATIRETITIARDTMRILKETRVAGGQFAFRHGYVMHR